MNKTNCRLFFQRRPLVIIILATCLLVYISLYYLLINKQYDYLYPTHFLHSMLSKIGFFNDVDINKLLLSKYAVCKSQLSKPLVCNKLSEGRIYVSNENNLINWGVFASNNWGNTLSPYWQARGAAFLMGSSFTCNWGTNTWMKFLPGPTTPPSSNSSCVKTYPELFYRMCNDSGPDCNMVYAHKCAGAWNYIQDVVQKNTRSAMERWAAINNQTIPFFTTSEIVVYDRCERGTILGHDEHGPIGYSAFQYIPRTVTIVRQVYAAARNTSFCNALRQSQIAYLHRIRPDITVIPSPGSIWEDFAKLVYAPHVLVMSAGSSFSLWSTLANIGHVWTPPLYGGMTPYVGRNFHWIKTPILYPNIGRKLNIINTGNATDNKKIIDWLIHR